MRFPRQRFVRELARCLQFAAGRPKHVANWFALARHMNDLGQRAAGHRRFAALESLESRTVMASAGGVENVLLPEFIAQMADPNGNQLPASDAWWALRSQRNLAIDEPISKVQNFAAHNAFNSLNEGFNPVPFLSPNQILTLSGLLDVGARSIELDIHDPILDTFLTTRPLILKHSIPPYELSRFPLPFTLREALGEIRGWLDRTENRNELIFLDFEDGTSQSEAEADEKLLPLLERFLGSEIYRPSERAVDGQWPSRAELIQRGKRVVIFSHRNDTLNGRFGEATLYADNDGHRWFGSRLAFRANGGNDLISDRGVLDQMKVEEYRSLANPNLVDSIGAENTKYFFSVQGDSLRGFGAERYQTEDIDKAVATNVDFLKMDFLFGDDEDAGLGTFFVDRAYDIPQGNRVALMEHAVWSWEKNDPAVDRQMFEDLTPNDRTGAAMFNLLATRLNVDVAIDLLQTAKAAQQNGRDVAILNGDRWRSSRTSLALPLPFAARSALPRPGGEYEWRLTSATSRDWASGNSVVQAEFGSDFVFSAPVNGAQQALLRQAANGRGAWLNVHDFDRTGNWQIGNTAPNIVSLKAQPSALNEGDTVQLSILFEDELEPHTLNVNWGDGSPVTVLQLAADQTETILVSHTYRDDAPSGTPSDTMRIKVKLTDSAGLVSEQQTSVTVRNLAPVILTWTNNAATAAIAANGRQVMVNGIYSDAGIFDSHTARVDWGDGTPIENVQVVGAAGNGSISGSHRYSSGGIFKITVTLSDDDTGLTTATTTAFVTGVGISNRTLYVIGSSSADNVSLNESGKSIVKVHASFAKDEREFSLNSFDRMISYLGDGDDQLTIAKPLTFPVVVHGGRGNDKMDAGGGPSALLGEEGDDELKSAAAPAILIGGLGWDRLVAGSRGDVLIGGTTNIDSDDERLFVRAIDWASTKSFQLRWIAFATAVGVTDDSQSDRLTAGAGLDLIYANLNDLLKNASKDDRLTS